MSTAPSNMVTWFQIPAADEERAWRFYAAVFGWSAEKAYADQKAPGAINGAIAARSDDLATPRLVIRVDDVDRTGQAIREAGGRILSEPLEIPDIGMVFAVFADTEGNVLNIVGDAG